MSGACKVCARQVGVDVYDLCIVVVVVVTIAVTTVVGVVVVVVAVSSSCRVMVVVLLKTPIGVSQCTAAPICGLRFGACVGVERIIMMRNVVVAVSVVVLE